MTKGPLSNEELQEMMERAIKMAIKHINEMEGENYLFGRLYISCFTVFLITTHPSAKTRDDAQEFLFDIFEVAARGLDNHYKDLPSEHKVFQNLFFDMMAKMSGTNTGKPN